MKSLPFLRCPKGGKTVEQGFKLVQCYGPPRTPLYRCFKCGWRFSGRHDSVFAGFHPDEQTLYRVLKALAAGNGIRATARIFAIDKNTVGLILEQAARHCQQVSEHLMKHYHREECQLDELWAFVKKRTRTCRPLTGWRPFLETRGCGSALIRATK